MLTVSYISQILNSNYKLLLFFGGRYLKNMTTLREKRCINPRLDRCKTIKCCQKPKVTLPLIKKLKLNFGTHRLSNTPGTNSDKAKMNNYFLSLLTCELLQGLQLMNWWQLTLLYRPRNWMYSSGLSSAVRFYSCINTLWFTHKMTRSSILYIYPIIVWML